MLTPDVKVGVVNEFFVVKVLVANMENIESVF